MKSKPIPIMFATLLAAAAAPAIAIAAGPANKPLGQWSCEDFLAVNDQIKPKVVYWATAYAKGGKPEAAVLDIDATETVTPAIIDSCTKAPKNSFWQTVTADMAKVKSAAGKDVSAVEKAAAKDAKAVEKDANAAAKKVEKAM
jgi:acid stress chaperone HdeA